MPFLFLHPIYFWSTLQVRVGRAPTIGAAIGILIAMTGIALICLAGLAMALLVVIDPRHSGGWVALVLLWGTIVGIGALLVLVLMMAVHRGLCSLVLSAAGQQDSHLISKIIGYGWAWAAPAAALLLCELVGLAVVKEETGVALVLGWMPIVLLPVVCLLWAVSFYAGALRLGRCSSGRALLCVLVNPFWYVLGLVQLWRLG